MGIVGQQMNAKFALAVGDNFYSTGISTDVHDQRFKSTFEVRHASSRDAMYSLSSSPRVRGCTRTVRIYGADVHTLS